MRKMQGIVMGCLMILVMGTLIPIASGSTGESATDMTMGKILVDDVLEEIQIENRVFQDNINIRYSVEDLIRGNRHYSRIVIEGGALITGNQGEERPFMVAAITVPGELSAISVDFKDPIRTASCPTPSLAPGYIGYDDDKLDSRWNGGINEKVDTEFELIRLSDDHGSMTMYSLKLFPIEHIVSGDTIIYRNVKIKLEIDPLSMKFEMMDYSRKPTGPTKYLIITDESLVEAVKPLAEWKSQKGLFSRIATTREIDSMYDKGDLPGKMRQFVMDMEAADDLDYLLLAGDWDKVPSRNTSNNQPASMYGEPGYFASDIYFACVDVGTTWNKNSNSKYAEPGEIDDPVPDMAFGRLAVNDPTVLSDVVNALVEREINLTWESDYNTAVYMAGDNQNVPGESTEVMDHFWTEYGSDNFPGRETIYYDGSGSMAYSSESFLKIIDDQHQVLGYFSHGQATTIPNLVTREDLDGLNGNGYAGSFFAMACMTGWFDKPGSGMMTFTGDCIGESLTERPNAGVIGYMGANRLAAGNSDTSYSGDAPGLQDDYYNSVEKAVNGEIDPTVGNIYRNAVTHFVSAFYPFPNSQMDVSERTFLEYNLFGEPDAPLILNEVGELSINYYLSGDSRSIYAEVVDSDGNPVEGAAVTISRYGELGLSTLTNANGEAYLNIPDSNGGLITITAYRSGDRPDFGSFVLPDTLEPEALYSMDPEEPDGRNGIYLTPPEIMMSGDEDVSIEYQWDGGEAMSGEDETVVTAPDGMHTLNFRAIDMAGHKSTWVELPIEVDSTPPGIDMIIDPDQPDGLNGYYISEPRISLQTSEEIEKAYYSIDGGSDLLFIDPIAVGEGEHTVEVTAYDMAGNVNTTKRSLIVDTTPPMTRMKLSHEPDGENGIYITPPEIELQSMLTEETEIVYRWDNDEWSKYTAPLVPGEGSHVLGYKSIDTAGNVEAPIIADFTVDTVDPLLSIEINPAAPDGRNGIYTSNPVISMKSEDVSIEYILIEAGEEADWSKPMEYGGELIIPEGEWTILGRITDDAGNMMVSDPVDLSVDTTPPEISGVVRPEDPTGKNEWYISDPYLSMEAQEDDLVLYYRIDNADDWILYSKPVNLGSGIHTPEIMAEDQAGNSVSFCLGTIKVDLDYPLIHNIEPANGTVMGKTDLHVSWNADDPTSDVAEIKVKIDEGAWLRTSEEDGMTFAPLNDGYHNVNVMVEDSAGNMVIGSRHLRIDRTAPSVIAFTPQGMNFPLDSAIIVQFSEEMDRGSLEVTINDEPAEIDWNGNTVIINPEGGLQKGTEYDVILDGSDLYGNRMNSHVWSFSIIEDIDEGGSDADGEKSDLLPVMIGMGAVIFILLILSAISVVVIIRIRRSR